MHFRAYTAVLIVFCYSLTCLGGEPAFSPFLANMPMNANKRCVGIAGVANALVKGERVEGTQYTLQTLARDIYGNFAHGKPIKYPPRIVFKGKTLSIDDPLVLQELSTRVANLYKRDYDRLRGSPEGNKKLLAAEDHTVKSRDEFVKLLQGEPHEIGFFGCMGTREFPNRRTSHSSHAVLFQLMPHNVIAVYDPNEPGSAIECSFDEDGDNLLVRWKCKYRDQGVITTQYYEIVPQRRYFSSLQ